MFLACLISISNFYSSSFTFCPSLLAVAEEGMYKIPGLCSKVFKMQLLGIENLQENLSPIDILPSREKVRETEEEKENLPLHILFSSSISKGSPVRVSHAKRRGHWFYIQFCHTSVQLKLTLDP